MSHINISESERARSQHGSWTCYDTTLLSRTDTFLKAKRRCPPSNTTCHHICKVKTVWARSGETVNITDEDGTLATGKTKMSQKKEKQQEVGRLTSCKLTFVYSLAFSTVCKICFSVFFHSECGPTD